MEQALLESAIRMMMRTDRMHRGLIEDGVKDIGLHRTAHMILMTLAREKKCPSQKELAERFSITPAAVTGILKNLERDGYIIREVGRDTRYNEISITERGREVVEISRKKFREVDSSMFSGFSDEELRQYIAMLEKIQANMDKKMEDSL